MVPDSEVAFLADVIQARQHDELVVEHVFEAAPTKKERFVQSKKDYHRGKGSRNTLGKRRRVDTHIRVKRRAVAPLREGQTFATIQRAIWDVTNEQFFLVNQRQLNNWVKIVDKLEGCVIARTAKRIKRGGRRVHYMQYDVALYQWLSDRRAQNQPVTARQLNEEAQRTASVDGRMVSRCWLEKFRKRHSIVLQKCQRKTQLSAAEHTARLQKFYAYIYLQRSTISVWVNFDEIPATLAGVMGNVQTLEHAGTANVIVNSQESHFKRMGSLIAMLGGGVHYYFGLGVCTHFTSCVAGPQALWCEGCCDTRWPSHVYSID